jgi:hypothetical protein
LEIIRNLIYHINHKGEWFTLLFLYHK